MSFRCNANLEMVKRPHGTSVQTRLDCPNPARRGPRIEALFDEQQGTSVDNVWLDILVTKKIDKVMLLKPLIFARPYCKDIIK